MSLHPLHLQDLKDSGLSDETIALMAVYSMSPAQITRFVGSDNPAIESALAFPYFAADGSKSKFIRIKIFPTLVDAAGHKTKYLQPKDSRPALYILPAVTKYLDDAKQPLYVVEGEKKTAKACEDGLAAVGIGGVWNWVQKSKQEPIEDFSTINLWRREIVIVPDSDTWGEEKKAAGIRRAVYYLARELKLRGAGVRFLKLGL